MYLQVNGHNTYCYTGGKAFDATRPTVVFIHGVLNDHSVWILQSRYLAHHGFNVLAIDLPVAREILIVDDNGNPVAPGETGYLLTRGPYTIRAYHNNPSANARKQLHECAAELSQLSYQQEPPFLGEGGRRERDAQQQEQTDRGQSWCHAKEWERPAANADRF